MEKSFIYQVPRQGRALRQGEILGNIIQYKPVSSELTQEILAQESQEVPIIPFVHSYVIVVTQDCDLDWDYNARNGGNIQTWKLLNSVLLCEISTAQEIRTQAGNNINRKEWELVKTNRHERYYFFGKVPPECDSKQEGLPELTVDFKRVFGIDTEFLYRQVELECVERRTSLVSPYLEHFFNKFHNFHGRIALPFPHESQSEG